MIMNRKERIEMQWNLLYDEIKAEQNTDYSIKKEDFVKLLEDINLHLTHAIKDVKNENKICDVYRK